MPAIKLNNVRYGAVFFGQKPRPRYFATPRLADNLFTIADSPKKFKKHG